MTALIQYKDFPGGVIPDRTLGARQVRGIASNGSEDRDGDIVDPAGADLAAYKANPIVQYGHNSSEPPVGTAAVVRTPSALEATISFAPVGASQRADTVCALCKSGVIRALSIGFRPTAPPERRGDGRGFLFRSWQLLELSLVAVPSNESALIMERSFGTKDGRVLAAVHAAALRRAHRYLATAEPDMAQMLEQWFMNPTSGRAFSPQVAKGLIGDLHGALTMIHKRIGAARGEVRSVLEAAGLPPDDGDFADPEDSPDQELAFEAWRRKRISVRSFDLEADRRARLIAVAAARPGPLAAGEAAARDRLQSIARAIWSA